jgi:3'-phosphoadenosine 5'-phosphosulfate sulfotransferase (PAPS reductase)/FAD synthetase
VLPYVAPPAPSIVPDLRTYDTVIVYFSGGKDSLAALIRTLELAAMQGRDLIAERAIELWHHDVDSPESGSFMDWPVTPAYTRAVGEALGIPVYFSWKVGGYMRELLRDGTNTAPIRWEEPGGGLPRQAGGTRDSANTRMKFPQVTADLTTRWCSSYLKIDVGAAALGNQERFTGKRTLTVSGERAEESGASAAAVVRQALGSDPIPVERAEEIADMLKSIDLHGRGAYAPFEPDRSALDSTVLVGEETLGRLCVATGEIDVREVRALRRERRKAKESDPGSKVTLSSLLVRERYFSAEEIEALISGFRATRSRHVDRWRPVHHWVTAEVWDAIRRWGIVPHPAYRAGFGRVSCAFCIFGSPDQWATLRQLMPEGFARIANLERRFGLTIDRSGRYSKAQIRLFDKIQAAGASGHKLAKREHTSVEPLVEAGLVEVSLGWAVVTPGAERPSAELWVDLKADQGAPYPVQNQDVAMGRALALRTVYDTPIRVRPEEWILPAGAFAEGAGPT